MYDPYSDDPRLAIHKLYLCALSETLVVGGTAGQVIVMQFEREARQQVKCHIVIMLQFCKTFLNCRIERPMTPDDRQQLLISRL